MSVKPDFHLTELPDRERKDSISEDNTVKPSPEHIPDEYEHKDNSKGKVYIFYDGNTTDVHNIKSHLCKTLSETGYTITGNNIKLCQKKSDIDDKLTEITKENHEQTSCLIIFFFGEIVDDVKFLLRDDDKITTNYIWGNFTSDKCPALKNIPKIFIFEGRKYPPKIKRDSGKYKPHEFDIPAEADLLLVFKVYNAEKTNEGFIEQFCDNIKEIGAREDIITLITLTENHVTRPLLVSTLTRKFYITSNECSDKRGYHYQNDDKTNEINNILVNLKTKFKIKDENKVDDDKMKKSKTKFGTLGRKKSDRKENKKNVNNEREASTSQGLQTIKSDGKLNGRRSFRNFLSF